MRDEIASPSLKNIAASIAGKPVPAKPKFYESTVTSLPNLCTTSPDPDAAFLDACGQLARCHMNGGDIDRLFIESAIHSADKLNVWAELIEDAGHGQFNAEEVYQKNSLLLGHLRSTTHPIVVSSVLMDHLNTPMTKVTQLPDDMGSVERWGEIAKYKTKSGLELTFNQASYGESKGKYKNRFDFLNISTPTAGKYIKAVAVPYESIDYRICAALSECGVLDRFSEGVASLIGRVGHDFVHSCVKNGNHGEINGLVNRTNKLGQPGSNIIGEELWALMTHSSIYDEMKDKGYAKILAHEGRALMDVINEFEKNSKNPDAHEMAGALRDVLGFHLSCFVKREKIDEAITQGVSEDKLSKIFLKQRPGNTSNKIVLSKEGYPRFEAEWYHKLLHTTKVHIFKLAADSFSAVNDVFAKKGDAAKLGELQHDIEEMRARIGVQVEGVEQLRAPEQKRQQG